MPPAVANARSTATRAARRLAALCFVINCSSPLIRSSLVFVMPNPNRMTFATLTT
jgi:hypothetical protein